MACCPSPNQLVQDLRHAEIGEAIGLSWCPARRRRLRLIAVKQSALGQTMLLIKDDSGPGSNIASPSMSAKRTLFRRHMIKKRVRLPPRHH